MLHFLTPIRQQIMELANVFCAFSLEHH